MAVTPLLVAELPPPALLAVTRHVIEVPASASTSVCVELGGAGIGAPSRRHS